MATEKATVTFLSPETMAEMLEAANKAAAGIRDPEAMRQACVRMDRISEQIRQREGVLNIGVQIIRELRDAE